LLYKFTTYYSEVGLTGLPPDFNFELHGEVMEGEQLLDAFFGDESSRQHSLSSVAIKHIRSLNADQFSAFEIVKSAICGRGDNRLFFIEGAGGCGMTLNFSLICRI